ncbi:MAG: DNA topoisomerase IV subunit A [Sutterellaceae bacterium]|nr:DNA topoisomerase IV subunit A [Sutterellaceae bacterium]
MDAEDSGELTLARYAARAYLEYALSVVKSRALPDVFDGMKPVQRRILYSMDRMRLAPPAKAVKCARVVGDVLGKYHPHGDQAAYDAMVRMAQDFSLRYPLVDGQGNFGSRDGDGPAAMRYTEARLTKIAELVLEELDSGNVDFVPNYDGSFQEPTQLPAKMPFVLLNGASGIAVGMATEIPSHNLTEVGEAVIHLLRKPEATLDDILEIIPAPDYPGGGQITSPKSEIRQVYQTGRGSLRVRARYHFEELQHNQWQLVVDELPPATNAEKVLTQIEEITNPKPKAGKKALSADQQQTKAAMLALLDGVRNECDKDTKMRLVFEPKSSKVDRDAFVNALLSQTDLECNAPMNLVMIGTDGKPKQKNLLEILNEWIQARKATVRRRTQARLEKVNLRLHILEGRSLAIDNIDRVIEIVRFEEKPKPVLMAEFNLTDTQAEDILELRLRQLANLEFERILAEMKKLNEEKAELERILGDEKVLKNVIAKETKEAIKLYGDERRTLVEEAKRATMEQRVVTESVTIVISKKGFVRCRTGHGHDCSLMNYKIGDAYATSFECESSDLLIAVGDNGRVYSVPVSVLPPARGDGLPITSFIELEPGTDIIGYVAGAKQKVIFATTAGFGMTCAVENLRARVKTGKAFVLIDDPKVKMLPPIMLTDKETWLACLTSDDRMLVFQYKELRKLADGGKGVTLMEIKPGQTLVKVLPLSQKAVLVKGQGKTTVREKILVKGDFERHIGKRSRVGRQLDIRFKAEDLEPVETPADEVDTTNDEDKQLF